MLPLPRPLPIRYPGRMCQRITARIALIMLVGLGLHLGPLGCAETPNARQPLVLYAAMSLIDVLPPLTEAWTQEGNPEVHLEFASTSRLARQIEAGAPADAFISADTLWPATLHAGGHLLPPPKTPLALNTMVVIVPANTQDTPRSLKALSTHPGRLVIGDPGVPVGRHALHALAEGPPSTEWHSTRIHGTNARHVLRLVAMGEADAGIVYHTDALSSQGVKTAFPLEHPREAPLIGYFPCITQSSHNKDAVQRLLKHLKSTEPQNAFLSRGFLLPATQS